MLKLIFSRLPTERSQAIGSAVFYGTILSNTIIIGLAASVLVSSFDWQVIYYVLIGFEILSLIIILFLLNANSGSKKFPLYQIDWTGGVIFAHAAISSAYLLIYGSKYYWFTDARICIAAGIAFSCIFIFIYRQMRIKRPLIDLKVVFRKEVLIGLCLLGIYYGSKDSINLLYNYAASILRWDSLQVMTLGTVNLAAMVISLTIVTRYMLRKRHGARGYIVLGFMMMGGYAVYTHYLLTPDLAFTDLIIPVIMQGAASGLLFVPIIIFILSAAPATSGTSGLVAATYSRFIGSLNSIAGYYYLQLYFNRYFRQDAVAQLTGENQLLNDFLRNSTQIFSGNGFTTAQAALLTSVNLNRTLEQQTQLLSMRSIFKILGILQFIIAIMVFCLPSLNRVYIHWSKSMFGALKRAKNS